MAVPDAQSELTHAQAVEILEQLCAQPSLVNVAKANRQFEALSAALPHASLKLACTSTFTLDPLLPSLRLAALRAGIGLTLWNAPFGQVTPTLIDPGSGIDAFAPDVLLVAVRLADAAPDLYDGLHSDGTRAAVSDYLDQLEASIIAFRNRQSATILIQNLERPGFVVAGLAETDRAGGQLDIWKNANARLQSIAANAGNCYAMDYESLVSLHGRESWTDARMELFGRIPIAAQHYFEYARFVVRYLRPLAGRTRKVVVVDADNTLWGGILGDDGLNGIKLGHDFPGNAFVRFQRRLLALQQRGIVLCIASKNEPGSVEHAVANHPDMVLKPEHFACMEVSWAPKPERLRAMASTLNLGLDSFVFIDDSAVECAMMRASLPEVMTIQLPDDPARYAGVIESLDCFDEFRLSDEDRQRGVMYKAEADRKQLASRAVDLPTFYRSLQMRLSIGIDDAGRAARAAQMTQRTNQFNMHTIRCVEDDILAWIRDDEWEVITLGLSDRFGDSGVVGLAIVLTSGESWRLHMLLMSCRVLGRSIESTFVKWIAGRARAAGASKITAAFIPTEKNKPFADFYHSCGFEDTPDEDPTRQRVLNLDSADTTIPDWFIIEVSESASA